MAPVTPLIRELYFAALEVVEEFEDLAGTDFIVDDEAAALARLQTAVEAVGLNLGHGLEGINGGNHDKA